MPSYFFYQGTDERLNGAISVFKALIDFEISKLAEGTGYDSGLHERVGSYLRSNAGEAFRWAPFVCQRAGRCAGLGDTADPR